MSFSCALPLQTSNAGASGVHSHLLLRTDMSSKEGQGNSSALLIGSGVCSSGRGSAMHWSPVTVDQAES